MSPNSTHAHWIIQFRGDVQGVGFRATALQQARGLAIDGYVRNESDGSVRVDAQGPTGDVKELIHRMEAAMADRISDTSIQEQEAVERREGFSIRWRP